MHRVGATRYIGAQIFCSAEETPKSDTRKHVGDIVLPRETRHVFTMVTVKFCFLLPVKSYLDTLGPTTTPLVMVDI